MKKHIIILILIFSNSLWSQRQFKGRKYYTVIAPSGLSVREIPSIKGKRLGKFLPGEYVELIKSTKKRISVLDNGELVKGFWFKVKKMRQSWDKKSVLTGYVFSGYLFKNSSKPYNNSDAITTKNAKLKFENFDITFYFYNTQDQHNNISKKDTLKVYEDTFNSLHDKLIYVKSKTKVNKVEMYYTFKEEIWETKKVHSKEFSWKGNRPFKKLPLTRGMALFPKIEYEKMETFREINLNLNDTLVHYPGEMGGTTATMSYKGRPCVYFVSDVILKVVLYHANNTKEIKYININLSYGC